MTDAMHSAIPSGEQERELYRAAALAHRNARRQGSKPHVCHWAAVAAVQQMRPWLPKREAEAMATKIIRVVSQEFPAWFWKG